MKRLAILALATLSLYPAVTFSQEPLPPCTSDPAADVPPSWGTCCPAPAPPRLWATSEYLMWWINKASVPTPLLTLATVDPAVDPTAGQIGSKHTEILLGGQDYSQGIRYGGRFTLGGWFDCDATVGFEGNYLFIAPKSTTQAYSANGMPGSPQLAFPFFNVLTGKEDALIFTTPTGLAGSSFLTIRNQLQGAEGNGLFRFVETDNFKLTGLAGFRYLYFQEGLLFQQGNRGLPGTPAEGQVFVVTDQWQSSNNFYGGQLGLRGEYRVGHWFISATAKAALGIVNQSTDVSGMSTEAFAMVPLHTVPGGTFALSTNSGHHSQNRFGVLPEGIFNAGYEFGAHLRAFVGYDFLYLNNVARPGASIDHDLNITQSPPFGGSASMLKGTPAPIFSFNRSDLWVQGINFGLEFRY
jgi:hypothetical protein